MPQLPHVNRTANPAALVATEHALASPPNSFAHLIVALHHLPKAAIPQHSLPQRSYVAVIAMLFLPTTTVLLRSCQAQGFTHESHCGYRTLREQSVHLSIQASKRACVTARIGLALNLPVRSGAAKATTTSTHTGTQTLRGATGLNIYHASIRSTTTVCRTTGSTGGFAATMRWHHHSLYAFSRDPLTSNIGWTVERRSTRITAIMITALTTGPLTSSNTGWTVVRCSTCTAATEITIQVPLVRARQLLLPMIAMGKDISIHHGLRRERRASSGCGRTSQAHRAALVLHTTTFALLLSPASSALRRCLWCNPGHTEPDAKSLVCGNIGRTAT
mmetsp:Transcript_67382/g.161595  ORF Transcript_67382/g.161595 Transcript_67382/m.161595 type:complete len:332 (-) Transcript_67382:351-1346(-)